MVPSTSNLASLAALRITISTYTARAPHAARSARRARRARGGTSARPSRRGRLAYSAGTWYGNLGTCERDAACPISTGWGTRRLWRQAGEAAGGEAAGGGAGAGRKVHHERLDRPDAAQRDRLLFLHLVHLGENCAQWPRVLPRENVAREEEWDLLLADVVAEDREVSRDLLEERLGLVLPVGGHVLKDRRLLVLHDARRLRDVAPKLRPLLAAHLWGDVRAVRRDHAPFSAPTLARWIESPRMRGRAMAEPPTRSAQHRNPGEGHGPP